MMATSTHTQEKLYALQHELRHDYLFVQVSGDSDSLEVSLQFWKEILNLVRQYNASRLLVTENFANSPDQVDIYVVANRIIQLGFFNTRIAFVDEAADQLELNLLGARIAGNRGIKCNVFATVPEAEVWLRHS